MNHETFSPAVRFFLSEYAEGTAKSLLSFLNLFQDRIGLLSDAFTLCHANLMPCQITMNLVSYLPKEQNWGPMTTGLRHLEKWRRILKYSECFLMLTEVVKQILSKPVSWMGWNNGGKDEVKWVYVKFNLWAEFKGKERFRMQTFATRSVIGVCALGRNGCNKSGQTTVAQFLNQWIGYPGQFTRGKGSCLLLLAGIRLTLKLFV